MIGTLGVYGGTFSPPHLGHRHAADVFMRAVHPDKLMIIPTCLPPHKNETDGVTAQDRLAMCRIAFSDFRGCEVSDMEIRRGGKSYTSETLETLSGMANNIALLVGTDMMLTLDTWHDPETIFRLSDVYCVRREADDAVLQQITEKNEQYIRAYGKKVHIIEAPSLKVASTGIRDMLGKSGSAPLLDSGVLAYIRERGLYAAE